MQPGRKLFENYKQCEMCKCPLPLDYKGELCPHCTEIRLFQDVKDYIRANDVNEFDVANHFNIPLKQVKAWIREGRIEYKEPNKTTLTGLHCQRCGAPVAFGTLCPKCLKIMNGNKGYEVKKPDYTNDKMRFLDK